MRSFVLTILLAVAVTARAAPVWAQQKPHASAAKAPHKPGPAMIGEFEDWIAATNSEAGQMTCYAFTRVQSSSPALPGRGEVVLTVTQRPERRDTVAISAGFTYAATAGVTMQVDQASLDFYTNQRSAFARDGHAAVAAFAHGAKAVARSPGPKGPISDTFSLRGFTAAYAATEKSCPAK